MEQAKIDPQQLEQDSKLATRVLNLSPDLICVAGLDGYFKYLNRAWEKILGYSQATLLSKLFIDFIHPEDRAKTEAEVEKLAAGNKTVDFENRYLTQAGAVRVIAWTAIPLLEEGAIYAIGRDITEQKEAEDALRESEERFRRTFDQAPVGAAMVGLDYRFLRVNEALCHLTGYADVELVNLGFPDITHPDDLAEDIELAQQLEAGQIDHYSMNKRYIRKDGDVVWVHLTVRLIRDQAGQPLYYLPMMEDITERKQMEEKLRHIQKMEALGQLAGGIAHDFNNLLLPITGYAELGLMSVSPDEELYDYFKKITKSANRATGLIQQILAFSRQQVLAMELVDLNDVAREFQGMIHRLIREDINVELSLAPSLSAVNADKGQLHQVLMNLVLNACDAMPAGGKIKIKTGDILLGQTDVGKFLGVQNPGRYVLLQVSDTGQGMDAATKERIFDPFFTTKAPGKGTGLGLSTVFGIIKQHQGNIWVESDLNRGTTFSICFPQAEQPSQPLQQGMMAKSTSLGGAETILVAEDEEAVRQVVCEALVAHGYNVIEAVGSLNGVQLATNYSGEIHLLLTDVVMPDMNGLEFYQHLSTIYPELKVLYMSGYVDDVVLRHGILTNEGQNFLQKPFTMATLTHHVRRVLDDDSPVQISPTI